MVARRKTPHPSSPMANEKVGSFPCSCTPNPRRKRSFVVFSDPLEKGIRSLSLRTREEMLPGVQEKILKSVPLFSTAPGEFPKAFSHTSRTRGPCSSQDWKFPYTQKNIKPEHLDQTKEGPSTEPMWYSGSSVRN